MIDRQALPIHQSAQRSLRLVSPPREGSPSPTPSDTSGSRRLQRDLEAARAEALSLRELLEELPTILEGKFQLRLRALLLEQRQLEEETAWLQRNLMVARSGEAQRPQPTAVAPEPQPSDSPITMGLGLRRALRNRHR